MEPDGFRNFMKHVFMPLSIEDPSLIDTMYPDSLEEMLAEEQNEMMQMGELPPVLDTDDHTAHLYIHRMLQPQSDKAAWAQTFHILEHEDALAKQKAQEQLAMQNDMVQSPQPGGAPTPQKQGAQRKSPLEAAAPLKAEARTSVTKN